MGFFTSGHIVLSPPPQVLRYVMEYLGETDVADRKPLHEVLISRSTTEVVDCVLKFLYTGFPLIE
jgi:hypothetical protein